jgi:DNA-nicking Smr family endonuclease
MSADEPRRRRRLSDHEHALWRGVTRSIAPLKRGRGRKIADEQDAIAAPTPADAIGSKRKSKPAPATRPHATPARPAPVAKAPPPLMPIDRRTRLRIARGVETIDARIDLHGRTQSEAHGVLLAFLRRAQADGSRIVLVITGKGSRDQARERGVLRRQVPLWLGLPEFRAYVLGVEDAHVAHGGEGALYVRLRRAR